MNDEILCELPLCFDLACEDIPHDGLERVLEIHENVRHELVDLLDLVAIKSLEARYKVKQVGKEKYQLSGHINAEIVQNCRISLEEMSNRIDEHFEIVFWPEDQLNIILGSEAEVDVAYDEDNLEPYRAGHLPIGEIFYQQLALAIDPYPEKKGADREIISEANELSEPNSPFSVLKKLNNPRQND